MTRRHPDTALFSRLMGLWWLTQIKRIAGHGCTLRETTGGMYMGAHEWARAEVERSLQQARELGIDPVLALRALLSAVVQCNQQVRTPKDLAEELLFLADNLDDQRDYAFMRP